MPYVSLGCRLALDSLLQPFSARCERRQQHAKRLSSREAALVAISITTTTTAAGVSFVICRSGIRIYAAAWPNY